MAGKYVLKKSQEQVYLRLFERIRRLEQKIPRFPLTNADPVEPVEGEVWIRSDTGQLCWVVGGVIRRTP